MIVWDTGKDKYFHNNEVSRDILKKIYTEKGIEGFKNYEFLCPSYVNEYSDIFGKQDFNGTKYNRTHKFIIVQKVNLYDLITQRYSNVLNKDLYDSIDDSYKNILGSMYTLGIFLCIATVGVFFITSVLFNNALDNNDKK